VLIEEVGCQGQGAGSPPRVVVGESDIRGARDRDADVSSGRPEILVEWDHLEAGVAVLHSVGCPVRRGVVHHDDPRLLRQAAEVFESAHEVGTTIPGHDDHTYPGVGDAHRRPCTAVGLPEPKDVVRCEFM